ncbi:hypothetical protein SCUCBS95973_007633 [Sporothrix curviconia]|uniref:NAD-dependent epimerase/dehydratase domain-containing protein n=1 Tax=Sporothrix curviconia TaxID=1260050 RepID=A0ABP0CHD9_9PEZI
MASATKKLVVCGGNGFLGSRICKFGVQRGWDVTSISRSGEPRWKAVSESRTAPTWARRVAWERADIFEPETYAPLLRGANYAVHSLGILLEADYKGILSGRDSPLAGLRKVFGAGAAAPNTPVSTANKHFTYEAMNRDSAVLAAKAAAEGGVDAFAYISASSGGPGLPSRYLSTKREAEQLLTVAAAKPATGEQPLGRPIFVRAPFMYDAGARPLTLPLAAIAGAGTVANRFTGGALTGLLGTMGTKPMKVDEVAEAVVEALSDESVSGALEVPQLVDLANRAWRKGML